MNYKNILITGSGLGRAMAIRLAEEGYNIILNSLLQRVGTAEDVVGIVSFLVSDDSNYMTGQIISICSGVVLH